MITKDDLKAVELALVEKGQASKRYKLDEVWELNLDEIKEALATVPSTQQKPSTEIQEILEYLDTTLHPIVSPDNWNVYSELYDMISSLPSAQSEKTEFIPDVKAVLSKRDCVNLSERVLATFYDKEHEEWTQQTVTIADVLDSVCDEYTILPVVQPEQRWIPVTEKLPEEDGIYIVSGIWGSGKKQVGECEFCVYNGHFKVSWNFDVKAWMPLPEPYSAEGRTDGK